MPEFQAQALVEELQQMNLESMAVKADISALELRLMKFIIAVALGQVAVFTAVMEWLLSLFQ